MISENFTDGWIEMDLFCKFIFKDGEFFANFTHQTMQLLCKPETRIICSFDASTKVYN